MSSTQFHKAVECADRYSLVSAQMWTFDQQRVIDKEDVMLNEMDERLRVSNDIGSQEKDLLKKVEEALVYDVDKIHVVADYHVHVPQKLITQSFNDLVANIKKHFSCQEESGKIEQ
ncbi:MAG: hypothetical protein GX567_08345 [Clostridia bacterium]|nr:hypothetical protein [Clostridia bacterium]